jgi:hypothetical protein
MLTLKTVINFFLLPHDQRCETPNSIKDVNELILVVQDHMIER